MNLWKDFWKLDNSDFNTGAAFAALGCLLTIAIVAYNEWMGTDCGTNNRYLLLGLMGLGGWGFAASLRTGPPKGPKREEE